MSARSALPALPFGPAGSVALLVVAFLVLPLIAILPMSFSDTRYLSMPQNGLSTLHYHRLLGDPAWRDSLLHSVGIALPAAALAVLLGLTFCLGAWQRQGRAVLVLQVLMLGPLIVPGIIHAVAYHRALSWLGLFDTFAGAILVHAIKGLPFAVLSISASLSSVHPATLQLARSFGASPAQALVKALLPQILWGIGAGFVLALVTSWDEIVVTMFITSRNVNTLPKQIWQSLFLNLDPIVAALGTLVLLATLLVLLALMVPPARARSPAAFQQDPLN
ncbi:ABC transporter permease [Tardiphaga sp. 619_E2_N8_5]|uniref:ABC transporter permease n=1 Tax=unclassified Tardiphaga TaxID=2631404 RepID=UPI003F22E01F